VCVSLIHNIPTGYIEVRPKAAAHNHAGMWPVDQQGYEPHRYTPVLCVSVSERICVCERESVCVCVCVRERVCVCV